MTARTVTDEQYGARRIRAQRQGTLRRQFSHWAERLDDDQLDVLCAELQGRLPRLLEPAPEVPA